MRLQTLMLTLVTTLCLGLCLPAAAQTNILFFSHDLPGIGLPGTAVNAAASGRVEDAAAVGGDARRSLFL